MPKLTICAAAAVLAGCASTSGWRSLRIDGSSQTSFDESVALFQQELSPKRRDLFEISLVAVWLADTVSAGDFDRDGDVDADDVNSLLGNIQSGALVAAIRVSDENRSSYTAEAIYRQLDGLGYDEVLNLAGPELVEQYRSIRYARQRKNRANHRPPQGTWAGVCLMCR